MTTAQDPVAAPLPTLDIQAAIARYGCSWSQIESVAATGSTNADLLARAAAGAPEGSAIVADLQTAGRGRLDRSWQAPAGTALTFSVLLRPTVVETARWPWLPLLVGVAVCDAVRRITGLPAGLKWPNDLVLEPDEPRKFGGILVEMTGSGDTAAAVVGVGINTALSQSDLPMPTATSLLLAGADVDRCDLLAACLTEIADRLAEWRRVGGDPSAGLRAAYLDRCVTLGRRVRVGLATGELLGLATDVDNDGRLVVDGTQVAAGDVTHVRLH